MALLGVIGTVTREGKLIRSSAHVRNINFIPKQGVFPEL